jgi:hypothetical protein
MGILFDFDFIFLALALSLSLKGIGVDITETQRILKEFFFYKFYVSFKGSLDYKNLIQGHC